MEKHDLKKQFKELYTAKVDRPVTIVVPEFHFLMVDGIGDPNTSQEYVDAIQAIYPVAYTLKFMCKQLLQTDYGVMPMEGLWWVKDMANFTTTDKSNWLWTVMIMQPDFITNAMFTDALDQVSRKKSPTAIHKVRWATYVEGRAAQVLYVGPYAEEAETIQSLHAYIAEQGGVLDKTTKHHHEIYLNDPRRTDPARLKTIIRQPF